MVFSELVDHPGYSTKKTGSLTVIGSLPQILTWSSCSIIETPPQLLRSSQEQPAHALKRKEAKTKGR
jgi:hypothetical protein